MPKYGGLTLGQVMAMFPPDNAPMSVRDYYDADTLYNACRLMVDTLRLRAGDIKPFLIGLQQLRAGAQVNKEYTLVRTDDFLALLNVPAKVFSGD